MSSGKTVRGENGEGKSYQSMHSLWNEKLNGDPYDPKKGWYGKALSYWSKSPATINGVLGGFQEVHGDDIQESKAFITSLPDHGTGRALDCGAGIGRVTKHLLALMYDQTDVLEPVPHLLEQAKTELAGMRVGEFMQCSMENVVLQPNTYDLIVVQWAAIYLTDTDFVKFFSHCKAALTPRGYIFFKDNCANDSFIVDEADSSVIRCDSQYKALFAEAKLRVVKEAGQTQWPEGLLPQKMFALQ